MDNLKPKERNNGIDLLRIISMFMVVILHVLGQGGVIGKLIPFTINYSIVWILEIASYCAVNCYALISGYVGVHSKYKYTNFIMIWLRVIFYTIGITMVFGVFLPGKVGLSQIIGAVFPVMTQQYWYVTAYFFLFIFMPYLNYIINNMDRKSLKMLIISIIVILSIIPTITRVEAFANFNGCTAVWLAALYIIGGYVRKYGLFKKIKVNQWFAIYGMIIGLTYIYKIAMEIVTLKVVGESCYGNMFITYTSPLMLIAALSLLMAFKDVRTEKLNKIITFLSPLSFSVYIIHTNKLVWEYVIKDAFAFMALQEFWVILIEIILASIVIFTICIVIDSIRHYVFRTINLKSKVEKIEFKLMNRLSIE